ncbi:MAG: NADH-quinone oxidoreductase subunit L [Omnitrophica WOR_2 bacterium GWA2_47_8]|nr:MAG: NADH-quinone oxidoreductase subunit L [Omnitrophica WOR_2 bacterium GWA2_47_8]
MINIFFWQKLKEKTAWVSIAASALSCFFSLIVLQSYSAGAGSYKLGQWLSILDVPIDLGVTIDGLSVMMLLVVTIVATLIKIYSVGYMHGDPRYSRYFAYISLFTASMLGLVLADNFLVMYIFWEGVGLCSYLLIAFWFEKPAASQAGLKAFVTTRVGDTGFLLGILLLFFTTKTLNFADLSSFTITGSEGVLTAAALLIFLGAVGKSAQFPLHVWLPDAMEGPTAVSALIHAATMVAAGVYLVARCFALFAAVPLSLEVVAVIGAISAVMAASIATVNNDIKRVLAYSTVSQLGLMMLGLGVGSLAAGTFHLMTHAFFKALLFLCAGSVIHAVHTQDIWKMGGLFSKMKTTAMTFVIGTLALAGVPPLAGFWSKDEILSHAYHHNIILFAAAAVTSLLTAFYMSRLIFVVLFGKPRSDLHAHESPKTMTVPLVILSVFAIFVGFLGSPLAGYAFQKFILGEALETAMQPDYFMMGVSTAISLLGIGLAYLIYLGGFKLPQGIIRAFKPIHQLLLNKYYIDEIYDAVFVKPTIKICGFFFGFDWKIVDGVVNGVAFSVQWIAGKLKLLQTGFVQNYILVQVLGIILLIIAVLKKLWLQF